MKVTKDEMQIIENHVRTVINEQLIDLPKEKLISLVLLASNRIGNIILGKDPSSIEETKAMLETGLNFILTSHTVATQNLQSTTQCRNINDAALTFSIGHA
jgi:hypothetical protein